MYNAKITTKGQVTIPKEVREKMGLKPGDYLEIKETKEGYYIKKKVNRSAFEKYVGKLSKKMDSDKIVKDLRGK